jgi:hypothetical protein
LRGVKANQCPECGHQLSLLGDPPLYTRPFLIGLIALSALAGSFIWRAETTLRLFVLDDVTRLSDYWFRRMLIMESIVLLVTLLLLVCWMLARGWMLRRSRRSQWILALLTIGLHPVFYLIM